MTLVGLLNLWSMYQLCWVAKKFKKAPSLTVLAEKAYGNGGKWSVIISIWIMQLSICIGYLYFVGKLLDHLICMSTGGDKIPRPEDAVCDNKDLYIVLLTIPALILSFSGSYTFLSYISGVGIFIAIISQVGTLYLCTYKLEHDYPKNEPHAFEPI